MTPEGTWSIQWSADRVYISPPGGEGFDDIPRDQFDRMVAQYMWVQVEVRNFDDPETALLKRAHDILWPDEASGGAADALAASGREDGAVEVEGTKYTAAKLQELLDERDQFIVERGLWSDFVAQLHTLARPAANPEYTPEAIAEILRLDVEASKGRLITPAEFLADLYANPEPQADAVKALREALEPFADLARQIAEEHPGWDHNIFQFGYPFPETFMRDLRRARAALNLPAPDAVAVEPVADRLYKTLRHARAFVVLRMTPDEHGIQHGLLPEIDDVLAYAREAQAAPAHPPAPTADLRARPDGEALTAMTVARALVRSQCDSSEEFELEWSREACRKKATADAELFIEALAVERGEARPQVKK